MNKINPLYLLALFFVVMLASFSSLSTAQQTLKSEQNSHKKFVQKAVEFNTLNETTKKVYVDKILKEIKKDKFIKKARLNMQTKAKSYLLSLNKITQKAQEQLLNKILNEKLHIKNLYMDKNKMEVEISYE